MTTTLGKRKRKSVNDATAVTSDGDQPVQENDAQAVFRQYFEQQFRPIENSTKPTTIVTEDPVAVAEEDSDWDGLSEPEGVYSVQVEEYHVPARPKAASLPREELKDFMTSRPPSTHRKSGARKEPKFHNTDEDDKSEEANLKNDLALQRLLNESHLLDPSSSLSPSGSNRHKAIDLRLQSMGSKASTLKQERMPMYHRKGIVAKATDKEAKRRREAKENSIVLEKAKQMVNGAPGRRERSVGGPGVGKFTGGTLRLSKKDVADIEGPMKGGFSKKKGRRR